VSYVRHCQWLYTTCSLKNTQQQAVCFSQNKTKKYGKDLSVKNHTKAKTSMENKYIFLKDFAVDVI